ncbi:MAG: tRNA (adenosine(37)-N6)-threonylcarbamoyltransferase complex transferase subunit TsaD [Candidatus Micrarchaeota archaeon]|nr:tRNA (adenosine(37)-N6)-threonylcarbamoyltransferase complex transferase subunit TsaD [Candidatus Micrarchaeota archaeon]
MICLGFESTAHTLGVGICESRGNRISVLANCKEVYVPPKGEGILPRAAADHHAEALGEVLRRSLCESGLGISEIDLFSFSRGPGIGQCLRVGCAAAKFLASRHKKPVLGINHCHAHLEISRGMLGFSSPLYIYVSGANTQIIIENEKENRGAPRFLVLGETLDMGLGNLFDVFAREAGIHPSHGSQVARLAQKGRYFPLPYTIKGMNFAFAGLLSAALREVGRRRLEDICLSLMETSFAEICEAAERALCLTKRRQVLLCGGVAQNARFCRMLGQMCLPHGAIFGAAPAEFNADNGAMIAYTAISEWKRGKREKIGSLKPDGYWRIDQVR